MIGMTLLHTKRKNSFAPGPGLFISHFAHPVAYLTAKAIPPSCDDEPLSFFFCSPCKVYQTDVECVSIAIQYHVVETGIYTT